MKKTVCTFLAVLTALTVASCSKGNFAPDGKYAPPYDVGLNEAAGLLDRNEIPGIPSEDYGKLIENKFIHVSDNAVSTFSADVDTASYTYFRKLCSLGYSLSELTATAGNSIRTEEMINYFSYEGNSPKGGELFGIKSVISACPWNPEAKLLTLTLNTEKAVSKQKNNLVFLIDVSGSMQSADKLDLLKTSFSYLSDTLSEDDVISIVTYSGKEEIVLEGCAGNKAETIRKAVNSLSAGGSTNGQAGIQKAYEIAEKYFIQDGNNRIIMASDGDLNVGISSASGLKSYISEKRQNGIYLSVLGFGTGNYRDANMEAIADNGNGVYYYVDSEMEAEKIFCTDLLSTLYTVASDVKLQITFNPESVSLYRLVGYENRLLNKEDFEDDTKDAGELGAGHSVTVCYELITTDNAPQNNDWMKLAIRYKKPGEIKSNCNEYSIGKESLTSEPDDDFLFISAVTELSMLLHNSQYLKTDVTIGTIYETLTGIDTDDEYKAQFTELVKSLSEEQKSTAEIFNV